MKTIVISGEIGFGGIAAETVRKELNAARGEDIEVHFSSPGGSVFAGIEIFNLFRDYKRKHPGARLTSRIIGLAASMASYLAVNPAFDIVTAEDNGIMMIHNAWGGTSGDYREMKRMAEMLDGVTDLLAAAYMARTGKSREEVRSMMDAETWLFGAEIVDAGLADEIIRTGTAPVDKAAAITRARAQFAALSPRVKQDLAAHAERLALADYVERENPLLGTDHAGADVWAVDIKARPHWFEEMATFTPYGEKVAAEVRGIARELDDGVICGEADMRRAVAAARVELGLPPRDQTADDDAPAGGIIDGEASLEREVRRTRRALGLPPLEHDENKIVAGDGVIRTEVDMQTAVKAARRSMGLT